MRNEDELPKEVVTTAANHNRGAEPDPRGPRPLRSGSLAAILRGLAEQLCLERKDVIEDSIDSPALEAVVGDHPRPFEMAPQRSPQGSVHPRPSAHLRLFEQLKAAVERELPQPVLSNAHVPSTSTLAVSVTRTLTRSRRGSG